MATSDNNPKQKRQSNLSSSSNSRRPKRTPQHHNGGSSNVDEEVDKSESDELDEADENDEDETIDSAEEQLNRDRLDEMTNLRIPFWDTYDSINQLYLEMGEFFLYGQCVCVRLCVIVYIFNCFPLSISLSLTHFHFGDTNKPHAFYVIYPF